MILRLEISFINSSLLNNNKNISNQLHSMVEFVFDNYLEYSFPTFVSNLIVACDELGQEMEPPFEHGSYFIEIREKFVK